MIEDGDITRWTDEQLRREAPYLVAKLLTGARPVETSKEVCSLTWNGQVERLHADDLAEGVRLTKMVLESHLLPKGSSCGADAAFVLEVHRRVAEDIASIDHIGGRYAIAALADRTGSGYWRMRLPLRQLDPERYFVHLTTAGMAPEQLESFDAVFMQRNHTWDEFYLVERLKAAGVRVIYDIDDDIYHIPPHNVQAYHRIGEDEQAAATAIMRIADVITTPSDHICQTFGFCKKTLVIPNALDLRDGWPVQPQGSPEPNLRRIFWQGSASHVQDWQVFLPALDAVMKRHNAPASTMKVRLLIMGYLPPVVNQLVEAREWWSGQVEFLPFVATETYIENLKKLRADVGIAPLEDIPFSWGKSALKFIEYSAAGIPTVASKVQPYTGAIQDGVNGYLADGAKQAEEKIELLLTRFDADDRQAMVGAARKTVEARFSLAKALPLWEEALTGEKADAAV